MFNQIHHLQNYLEVKKTKFRLINMKNIYSLIFPKKKIPREYFKIYKSVEKNSY